MTMDWLQHAIVTLTAVGAALLVARRLFGVARPAPGAPSACANCPSSGHACHPATATSPASATGGSPAAVHPLTFVRTTQRP